MAINGAILAGAAVGAYTQDPINHPFASIMGAGIGAYAVSQMMLPSSVKPVGKVYRNLSVSGRDMSTYLEMFGERLDGIQSRITGYQKGMSSGSADYAKSQANKLMEYLDRLDVMSKNVSKYSKEVYGSDALGGMSLTSQKGRIAFNNYLNGLDKTSSQFRSLYSVMQIDTPMSIVDIRSTAGDAYSPNTLKIASSTNNIDAAVLIKEHLMKELGNPEHVAERKARIFSEKFAGQSYSISDAFNINIGGRQLSIPMTRYTANGTKYSKSGSATYSVKSFQPFAHNYANEMKLEGKYAQMFYGEASKELTAKDILHGFDPEESVAFINSDRESLLKGMQRTSSFVDTLKEYLPNDSLLGMESAKASRNSHLVNLSKQYSWTDDSLHNLVTVSTDGRNAAMHKVIIDKLNKETGVDVLRGVSMNDVNSISNNTSLMNFGLFETSERAGAVLNDRGYLSVGTEEARLKTHNLLGIDDINDPKYAGVSNAIAFSRIDVDDNMGKLASELFGSDVSLDDGAGFFRRSAADMFAVDQSVSLNFSNIGTPEAPKYALNGYLSKIGDLINGSDEAREFFERNTIYPEDVLGTNSLGEKVSLGKEYSFGNVIGASIKDDKSLQVTIKATHVPKEWVKIFSTATKSGLSGLSDDAFETIVSLENMRKSGVFEFARESVNGSVDSIRLRLKQDTALGSNGSTISIGRLRSILSNTESNANKFIKSFNYGNVQIISRAKDTGAEIFHHIASGNSVGIDEYAAKFNDIDDMSRGAVRGLKSTDKLTQYKSALYLQMITDQKGNSDAFVTLLGKAGQEDRKILLNMAATSSERFAAGGIGVIKAKAALVDIIDRSIKKESDLFSFRTLATMDYGDAIRGAGNAGSMSWLERGNLKMSGWTDEDILTIGNYNKGALLEAQIVNAMTQYGDDISANKLVHGDKIAGVLSLAPEERIAALKEMGIKAEGEYFKYQLQMPTNGVRSISIPLVSTNISGLLDMDGEKTLKQMDRARQAIIASDINLAKAAANGRGTAAFAEAKESFMSQLSEFEDQVGKAFQGENNLFKLSQRVELPDSRIDIVRSADGKFARYAEQQLKRSGILPNVVAMSQSGIEDFARRNGLEMSDLSFVKTDVDGIKKVMLKSSNSAWMAQVVREPAQGPLSSMSMEILLDSSIQGGAHNTFIPKLAFGEIKNANQLGQFADFDADTFRIASLHKMNKEQLARISRGQQAILEAASKAAALQNVVAKKGKDAGFVTLDSFKTPAAYAEYLTAAALKSKDRKHLAKDATDIATNMAATLDMRMKSLSGHMSADMLTERSIVGRSMIHNFVENLLKTQHTPTKERLTQPITHMEQFMAAHNQLKNGNVSVYRDQARRIFDEILGSKIKDRSMRATYDQAITDIIDSQVSHIGQITRSGFEQNAGRIASRRGIASISEHIQALASRTMLPGEATDDLIQAVADNARLSVRSSIDLANNVIGMNKKQFALGALGLAATAMFVGSEAPELSQDSLPTSTKSGILPPISDNKGYINKQPMGKSYQVRGSSDNTTSIRRDVSNFVGTPRANVRIVDKRDQRNK